MNPNSMPVQTRKYKSESTMKIFQLTLSDEFIQYDELREIIVRATSSIQARLMAREEALKHAYSDHDVARITDYWSDSVKVNCVRIYEQGKALIIMMNTHSSG